MNLQRLKEKLKDFDIKLVFMDIESEGCYVPEWRTIFVASSFSEESVKKVIYHELKHGLDHTEFAELYRLPNYHYKMESEANDYMITELIRENGGEYNYSQLIEEFQIGLGWDQKYLKRSGF